MALIGLVILSMLIRSLLSPEKTVQANMEMLKDMFGESTDDRRIAIKLTKWSHIIDVIVVIFSFGLAIYKY